MSPTQFSTKTRLFLPKTLRLFGLLVVAVVASTTVANARPFTPSEKQINSHLQSGKTVFTASEEQILAATKASLIQSQATYIRGVSPASLVATADLYAAKYAPTLAGAGLDRVQTFGFTAAQLNLQTTIIVSASMRAALAGNRANGFADAAQNKADGAAAVTASAVNSVKGSDALLSLVVRTAVISAQNSGLPSISTNGAAGAVTGAISQVAGVSNGDIAHATGPNDRSDTLVIAVIRSAVQAAPRRLGLIAEAAGYAFAGTYRATTASGNQSSSSAFLNTNLQGLIDAVLSGLPARSRTAALRQAVSDQVTAGISLAYSGYIAAGSKGVANFAANNGQNPVTDTTGL